MENIELFNDIIEPANEGKILNNIKNKIDKAESDYYEKKAEKDMKRDLKPITTEDYNSNIKPILNKIIAESKIELNKLFNDPDNKIAAKGFKPDFKIEDNFSISICKWDLWKIYPNDAKSRYGDDTKEFDSLYHKIESMVKTVTKKYLSGYKFNMDDDGDWDGGTIYLVIHARIAQPAKESLESLGFNDLFNELIGPAEEATSDTVVTTVVMAILLGIISAPKFIRDAKENKKKREADASRKMAADELRAKQSEFFKKYPLKKLETDIKNDIKKIVNAANKDPKIKKSIDASLKDWEISQPAAKFVYIEEGDDYIRIIDDSQEIQECLNWFIKDIAKAIELKYAEAYDLKLIHFSFGDGDEGCLYYTIG